METIFQILSFSIDRELPRSAHSNQLTIDRGHYDMIYRSTQPIRVMTTRIRTMVPSDNFQTPHYGVYQNAVDSGHVMPTAFMPEEPAVEQGYPSEGHDNYQLHHNNLSDQDLFYYPFNGASMLMAPEQGLEEQAGLDLAPPATLSPRLVTSTPSPTSPLPASHVHDLPQQPSASPDDFIRWTSMQYEYQSRPQESVPLRTGPLS